MRTGYSPYDMCNEAVRLIESCYDSMLSPELERQIILLLNKSESYDYMSTYQLATARKKFADLYYKNGITGSALEQYTLALQTSPKISVKKKIKELETITKSELVYSLNAYITGEPDYSNLKYNTITVDDDYIQRHIEHDKRFSELLGIDIEELQQIRNDSHEQLRKEVQELNQIYDPEFEKELQERLSKLDDLSKSEFYRIRSHRNNDDILSDKELDILTLEALERSYNYKSTNDNVQKNYHVSIKFDRNSSKSTACNLTTNNCSRPIED